MHLSVHRVLSRFGGLEALRQQGLDACAGAIARAHYLQRPGQWCSVTNKSFPLLRWWISLF